SPPVLHPLDGRPCNWHPGGDVPRGCRAPATQSPRETTHARRLLPATPVRFPTASHISSAPPGALLPSEIAERASSCPLRDLLRSRTIDAAADRLEECNPGWQFPCRCGDAYLLALMCLSRKRLLSPIGLSDLLIYS